MTDPALNSNRLTCTQPLKANVCRRDFLRASAFGVGAGLVTPLGYAHEAELGASHTAAQRLRERVVSTLRGVDEKIDRIAFYGIHVDAERRFSYAVQSHRQHAFVGFRAGQHTGWAEANLGFNASHPRVALERRVAKMGWFASLKGLTIATALQALPKLRDRHSIASLEQAEMALLDLAGRVLGKPSIELLGLEGRKPTPGVYCVLTDDPAVVAGQVKRAKEQRLTTHLKVKLYGKPATDFAVVRAARGVLPESTYLIGDVNFGYRRERSASPVNDLAKSLIVLRDAGLSACEDPAAMSIGQWGELQREVGPLDLVPDVPLRPSWKALEQVNVGMGRVFNIHPACMGSLFDAIEAGRVIRAWGRRLMVGDASLVGPACPAWQQLAIGMGADWVEAIEKPQENHAYQDCLLECSVQRAEDGLLRYGPRRPGFGVDLDMRKLEHACYSSCTI